VNVNVNQARGNKSAARIEHLSGFTLLDTGRHPGNLMARNRYIACRGKALRRVDHASASDQQVVSRPLVRSLTL
jgi:hypothetical protein